jgi:hypothetical protein
VRHDAPALRGRQGAVGALDQLRRAAMVEGEEGWGAGG